MTIGGVPAPGLQLVDAAGNLVLETDTAGRVSNYLKLYDLRSESNQLHFERAGVRLHLKGERLQEVLDLWPAGRTVHGRVVDEYGRPIPNVRILASYPGHHRVTADADGRFVLANATPEPFELRLAGAPVLECGDRRIVPASQDATDFTLQTRQARIVTLTVRGTGRKPAPQTDVFYSYRDLDDPSGTCTVRTETGPDGSCRLAVPPGEGFALQAGSFRTEWGWSGWIVGSRLPAEFMVQLERSEPLHEQWIPVAYPGLEEEPPEALRVWVWNPATPWIGARHAELFVASRLADTLCSDPSPDTHHTLYLYDHFLELRNLAPGRHHIRLWSPGTQVEERAADATIAGVWPPPSVDSVVPARSRLEVRFPPSPGGKEGDDTVFVRPAAGQGPWLHPELLSESADVVDGRAAFDLPPGRYTLFVYGPNGRRVSDVAVGSVPGAPVLLTRR